MKVDIFNQFPNGIVARTGTIDTSKDNAILAKLTGTFTALGVVYGAVVAQQGKAFRGYAKKSDLDQLTTETVTIPENFAGLEAVMVPTRLEEQLFRVVKVEEDDDCVTITARHVWYDNLQNHTIWSPTENTE